MLLSRRGVFLFLAGFLAVIIGGCTATAVSHRATQVVADSSGLTAYTMAVPLPVVEKIDRRAFNSYVDGLLYEGIGDYYQAAEFYRKALGYYPDSYQIAYSYASVLFQLQEPIRTLEILEGIPELKADGYALKAACHRVLGDNAAAKDAYVKLVELNPEHTSALSYLANYYRMTRNLDSTIWAYRLLTRAVPGDFRTLNDLGRLLIKNGDSTEAKEVFRQSMESHNGTCNPVAVANLGELFEQTGQLDSAEAMFKQGLGVNPDNLLLHRELAGLFFRQDSAIKALRHVRRIAELAPDDRDANRRLGILYFSLDSLEQADSVLSALVAQGEKDPADHYYLGRIAAEVENYERTRDEFTIVTELADTLAESWLDLGWAYRRLEDSQSEINTYLSGIMRMRNEMSAIHLYFALGAALEHVGDIDSAVAVFEEVLAHAPDHHQTLNYLGYMLADREIRLEYAQQLIEKAVELQPDNPAYLDSYGWVFYRLGNHEDAVHYLRKAAALDNNPEILDHLGDALNAINNREEALIWWHRALELQPDNSAIKEKLNR